MCSSLFSKAHTWVPKFLSNFYWHFLSISNRFWDIRLHSFQGLTLTFRGHLRSKIFPPFESPYMNSYLTFIDTFSLSCPVFEIFDFKVWYWMWMWMYTGIKVSLTFFCPSPPPPLPPSPPPLQIKLGGPIAVNCSGILKGARHHLTSWICSKNIYKKTTKQVFVKEGPFSVNVYLIFETIYNQKYQKFKQETLNFGIT